mmetsp:Transcript_16632/g.14997  ORF Transcript_16632/g.14997 Transcript_16632/m.14997 type:complete len:388 (+) Transcript_16632:3-1166(+)
MKLFIISIIIFDICISLISGISNRVLSNNLCKTDYKNSLISTNSLPITQTNRIKNKSKQLINFIGLVSSTVVLSKQSKAVDLLPIKTNNIISSNIVSKAITNEIDGSNDFIAGLVSGAASRIGKELILHPIDTIRARQQILLSNTSDPIVGVVNTIKDLYSGVGPALVGGIPAGALFFGVKDYSKGQLRKAGLSKSAATLLSVVITNIPFWLVKTPTEVLKTRQQIGESNESNVSSLIELFNDKGGQALYESLYSSYLSNFAYALPSDIIKFLAYESLQSVLFNTKDGSIVNGYEAAFTGSLASLIAQISTTPLDVARTRIMAQSSNSIDKSSNPIEVLQNAIDKDGPSILLAGIGPRSLRAICSGGIQFASYELTQNIFSKSRSIS